MASTVPSIRIVKSFPFKGGSRDWSNRYHFLGGTPADATHWHTLMDNVVNAEKLALNGSNTIIEALGYAAGSEVPVASKVYSTACTVGSGAHPQTAPGEVAALVRWSTAARSTKNHPIYCFNYYHSAITDGTSNTTVDKLDGPQKTALGTYAAAWISGFSDGTLTLTRCSPAGHSCTGQLVEEYVTHRDFPPTTSV